MGSFSRTIGRHAAKDLILGLKYEALRQQREAVLVQHYQDPRVPLHYWIRADRAGKVFACREWARPADLSGWRRVVLLKDGKLGEARGKGKRPMRFLVEPWVGHKGNFEIVHMDVPMTGSARETPVTKPRPEETVTAPTVDSETPEAAKAE